MVTELVNKIGTKKWSQVGAHLPGRTGKQCRERYVLAHIMVFVVGAHGVWRRQVAQSPQPKDQEGCMDARRRCHHHSLS